MTLEPLIWPVVGAVVGIAVLVTVSYAVTAIQAHVGGMSSPPPSEPETWQPKKPSIVRSETNSTASITVPAAPGPPLVWSVEPLNGGKRLVRLTVVYEQSADDSEFPTQKFAVSDSTSPNLAVEDEEWARYVKMHPY